MNTSGRKSGETGRIITSKTGGTGGPARDTSKTQKSENPEDDADPRRVFYNALMRLQAKAPVKALMRKLPDDRPIEVAVSSSRPELLLLLTSSGFQLRLGKELVGFFERPMFKAPREGLEGFDFELIHRLVLKRAQG